MTTRHKKYTLAGLFVIWTLVAAGVWASLHSSPPAVAAGAAVALAGERPQVAGVSMRLRLDLLDRHVVLPDPPRDLFSTAPITDPAATEFSAALAPVAAEPLVGAQIRYVGYVEMGSGTIALLRDGPEMYLARQGDRVGPGYLVTVVDATFVEIEYRGVRRRLPVHAPENGNDRR